MAATDTASGQIAAPPAALPPVFAGTHQPKPLRFDPAKLDGLSERLIRSHWENNYIGSVKTLNMVETRLAAALADADMPPVLYGGLKREELHRTGSVILHEIYFDGSAATARPRAPFARRSPKPGDRSRHGRRISGARACRWPVAQAG